METMRQRLRNLEQLRAYDEGKKVNAPADVDPTMVTALMEKVHNLEHLVAGLVRQSLITTSKPEETPGADPTGTVKEPGQYA